MTNQETPRISLPPIDAAYDPTLLTDDSDEYCWTPLQLAARGGHVAKVKDLLASTPSAINDPPRGYYGQTALQAACIYGHEDVVRLLLAAGADVHFYGGNNMQRTALQFACGQGNETVVDMLLDNGAQVNVAPCQPGDQGRAPHPRKPTTIVTRYNGRTALQAAAERGHIRIVSKLLDLGADVNAPPSPTAGKTALSAAAGNGFAEIVELLLQYGAEVNAPSARYGGCTALQAACLYGNIGTVNLLISAGADIHALGGIYCDANALHAAAERGHTEIIKILVEHGADVNAISARKGQTPIQCATRKGHAAAVQLLRELGAMGRATGGTSLFRDR